MRTREKIQQRIKHNLKKPSLRKQADFLDEARSPWYDIQLEWHGHASLFQVHYADPSSPSDSAELKHVFAADESRDEWVEVPRSVLVSARADQGLMGELHRLVGAMEQGRAAADTVKEAEPELDPEEEVEEL
jgi:hypothetical protein